MLGICSAMEPHAHTSVAWIPALQVRKLRLNEMKRSPINHRAGEGQRWDSGSCGNNGSQLGCLLLGGTFNRVHRQFSCHSLKAIEV